MNFSHNLKCCINSVIQHLEESAMTLQNRTDVYAPATLTYEQRRRVADALEDAQSENIRKNYAS